MTPPRKRTTTPRKATPGRAATRATGATAEPVAPAVVGEVVESTDPADVTAEVVWGGRTMVVKPPTLEQMAVIEGLPAALERLKGRIERDDGEVTMVEVTRLTRRTISTVRAVLRDQVDKDWIDDLIMDEEFDLQSLLPIFQAATLALRERYANRADRRAKATLVVDGH